MVLSLLGFVGVGKGRRKFTPTHVLSWYKRRLYVFVQSLGALICLGQFIIRGDSKKKKKVRGIGRKFFVCT